MIFLWAFFVIGFIGGLAISGIRLYFWIDDYRMRKRRETEQKEKH